MKRRGWTLAAAAVALSLGGGAARAAEAGCKLATVGELPVKFERNQPLVATKVNGADVWFLIDTGASSTMLFEGAARRLRLPTSQVTGFQVYGVGGVARVGETTIKDLTLGAYAAHNVRLMVVQAAGGGGDVVGVLGRDVLGRLDVEFDLAHRMVRLFQPVDCRHTFLAYWSPDALIAPMQAASGDRPPVILNVALNGRTVPAELDSGAGQTVVTGLMAANAGVKPDVEGPRGVAAGIGARTLERSTALFPKFQLAEETISHARIQVADIDRYMNSAELGSRIARKIDDAPLMLLGADFLRAHRVLISNSQHQVYFSYLGGTVFDLTPLEADAQAARALSGDGAPRAAPARTPPAH